MPPLPRYVITHVDDVITLTLRSSVLDYIYFIIIYLYEDISIYTMPNLRRVY